MEGRTMALRQNEERFTSWTHLENGKVMNRRLHRLEIQARDGRLHIVTGDKLPEFIGTCAGHGHKGAHVAEILLAPEKLSTRPAYQPPDMQPWPVSRDVVHMALGFIGFLAIRFFLALIAGAA